MTKEAVTDIAKILDVPESILIKDIANCNETTIDGVELALVYLKNYLVVKYAYLPRKQRGLGLYKKVLSQLVTPSREVCFEPSFAWFKENKRLAYPEVVIVLNRSYFKVSNKTMPINTNEMLHGVVLNYIMARDIK